MEDFGKKWKEKLTKHLNPDWDVKSVQRESLHRWVLFCFFNPEWNDKLLEREGTKRVGSSLPETSFKAAFTTASFKGQCIQSIMEENPFPSRQEIWWLTWAILQSKESHVMVVKHQKASHEIPLCLLGLQHALSSAHVLAIKAVVAQDI